MTENPFIRSAAILTEHLGYVPIALVDDVINAANEILYKCTAALDQFLASRYPTGHLRVEESDRARLLKRRRLNNSNFSSPSQSRDLSSSEIEVRDALDDEENGEIDIAAEMELGTAKFETLFESIVDKCFDKYELYLLRNLLIIPGELIEGGWIRLAHHRGIDFTLPPLVQTQQKQAIVKPRAATTRGSTTVEIEDTPNVENIPEPSPLLKASKGPQLPSSFSSSSSSSSSSPNKSSVETSSSDTALAANSSEETSLDSSGLGVENDADALYSQIADLQRQLIFEHTLSRLIAVQNARTSTLISEVLEPTKARCRAVLEFKADLGNESFAETQDGSNGDMSGLTTEEVAAAYREILPLEDTVAFLGERVRALLADTARAQTLLHENGGTQDDDGEEEVSSPPEHFSVNQSLAKYEAALFIDTFVQKVVQETGLSK
ncbi:uncharacterized protein SAPINGB_P004098 [Magnusiomyces paraingens]|uniref:Kinetochore-associated protein MTW1 n=1 Tax=Magnusiomyces paraingens TaxID=2606893 RepID=A0A5E8BSR4_9ASCO|nr:uncharacterized protein SAPINGB_P004098 [Saprochaete ingens]VVT54483.1 unnamed protein product [Saprochaete ingens]